MQNDHLSPEAQEVLARARRCGLPVVLGLSSLDQLRAAYADTPVAPVTRPRRRGRCRRGRGRF